VVTHGPLIQVTSSCAHSWRPVEACYASTHRYQCLLVELHGLW
jgi:hypothetical protein